VLRRRWGTVQLVKVAVAFDHRGVRLRDAVFEALAGHSVVDLGTDTAGVGASVAACKIAGIRAAICHDVYSAHQGVEHDDMNVLCLGSEVVGPSLARDLVRTFLAARFDGGERYVKRLEKIEDLERNATHA
jgi:ribose 5-phosphate isomerase B